MPVAGFALCSSREALMCIRQPQAHNPVAVPLSANDNLAALNLGALAHRSLLRLALGAGGIGVIALAVQIAELR